MFLFGPVPRTAEDPGKGKIDLKLKAQRRLHWLRTGQVEGARLG